MKFASSLDTRIVSQVKNTIGKTRRTVEEKNTNVIDHTHGERRKEAPIHLINYGIARRPRDDRYRLNLASISARYVRTQYGRTTH